MPLNLLLSTNKLFMKQISADTIIIIPMNKGKIDQYQDLEVKTFFINNAKAKDMVNVIQSYSRYQEGVCERDIEFNHDQGNAG